MATVITTDYYEANVCADLAGSPLGSIAVHPDAYDGDWSGDGWYELLGCLAALGVAPVMVDEWEDSYWLARVVGFDASGRSLIDLVPAA